MKIDLGNFFKYYKSDLAHHVAAVEELEKSLEALAPELLDDSAEWVNIFRNNPQPPQDTSEGVLPVPYYPQTDITHNQKNLQFFSCAMARYFKGTLGTQG